MAKSRWEKEATRRDALARISTITGRIVRRVVVIDNETTAREAVIYDYDSRRSAAAKLRRVINAA